MIISEFSKVLRHLSHNSVCGSIECEIFMVSVDGDNIRGRQKNMPPGSKPVDNCEEFSVVNVIISFCLVEGAGYTSDGSKPPSVIFLRENSPRSELRRIHF